ncbi:MAG: hypothetical protein RLY86_2848 [Pseudomonadota bacterium]
MTQPFPATIRHPRSPSLVADYLRQAGWTDAGPYGPYAHLYRSRTGREIVLPITDTIRDFDRRMVELVQDVAAEEGRAAAVVALAMADRSPHPAVAE